VSFGLEPAGHWRGGVPEGGPHIFTGQAALRTLAHGTPLCQEAAETGVLDWWAGPDVASPKSRCPGLGRPRQQQAVQPVHRLGAGAAQLIPAVREHAHHDQVVNDADPDQARAARRHHSDRVRVDRIGLRPLPVANTRTCADSLGGTSSTVSPSCTRRCARCLPMPLQPSTAHVRSGNLRPAASISA
jgi:hypothetical protein